MGKLIRRPAVMHALCLLVLLKLLTPPIIRLPVTVPVGKSSENQDIALSGSVGSHSGADRRAENLVSEPRLPQNDGADPAEVDSQAIQDAPRLASALQSSPELDRFGERDLGAGPDSLPPSAVLLDDTAMARRGTGAPHEAVAGKQANPVEIESRISGRHHLPAPWTGLPQIVVGVWLVGSIAALTIQVHSAFLLRRMLRSAMPAPESLIQIANRVAQRMGVQRIPKICVVPTTTSPMLCGLGHRACIVLPEALLRQLSPAAQSTVMAHELAHLRRGDQWVRLLEVLATALYWWHPVVWWARYQIEIAEEQCCDSLVLQNCGERARVYADALLDIVDFISDPRARRLSAAMSTGVRPQHLLRKRLVDLMTGGCRPTVTPHGRSAIAVAAVVCLFLHPTFFTIDLPAAAASFSVQPRDETSRTDPITAPQARNLEPTVSATLSDAAANDPPLPWAIATSPNGRYRLSVRQGYRCELRDVSSGELHILTEHRITCAVFSIDSTSVITGGLDGAVRQWDVGSGREMAVLAQQGGAIHSIALSTDGTLLAAAGEDAVIELIRLDLPDGRSEAVPMDAAVRCVRFSASGNKLAIALDTWLTPALGRVAVLDVPSRTLLHEWESDTPVGVVEFQSEDELLVADWSGRTVQWSLPALVPLKADAVAKERISAVSFSANAGSLGVNENVVQITRREVPSR